MPFLAANVMDNYSRMGDVSVIAVTIVVFILLITSYVIRNKSYRIFAAIIGFIFLAALVNIAFHELVTREIPALRYLLYILRLLYRAILFNIFFLFGLYASVVSNMKKQHARIVAIVASMIFAAFVLVDILLTLNGYGFVIDKTGKVVRDNDIFMIGYAVFVIFLAFLIFKVRHLVYKRIILAFYLATALSVIIRVGQMIINEASLTTMTFLIPSLTMLYTMHLNPYDISIGTLNADAMEDMIRNLYAKNRGFIIMSLLLPEYVGEGKVLPEVVKEQTRRFTTELFRNGTLFQVGNGQIIMIARKDKNPDYNEWMRTILKAFQKQYHKHRMPYKIVYGESFQEQIGHSEYISLIDTIHNNIPENEMHRINENDVTRFREDQYVTDQLEDIYRKADLNDPRVLVYCQPVFNIQTQQFDTAEALMRLDLEKTGIISPTVFIPIAEKRGYIHVLTKIILNKTCRTIRRLCDEGYSFLRISVNISTVELKGDGFCSDINRILLSNGVPGDKLALELTESQNQEDFMITKKRIEMLHEEGVKFYLDDFGTGYSNMERILELPFDIIKFDRSMVIASGENQRSERIVENLAKIFSDFNYRVLYEGIEDENDQKRCINMSGTYLQGFKFSRPIPIENLNDFFVKGNKHNLIN